MRLGDLLPQAQIDGADASVMIAGLTADSRKVRAGDVFFAVPGVKADGLAYAAAAARNGACAVVTQQQSVAEAGSAIIVPVEDVRRELACAAARFYPRQPAVSAAVTGTSGKTSVAAFLRQIWLHLGHQAAALGTTGLVAPSGETSGSLTTPDPVSLHETLDRIARDGVTHLVLEASSHGLDQRRLDGVRLACGAFTNLSRDHLDYHATMDDYFNAKMRLFGALLPDGAPAVIDADGEFSGRATSLCAARGLRVLTTGREGETIRLLSTGPVANGAQISVLYANAQYDLTLPLAGEFMTSNALVAAGMALAIGGEARAVFAALETLTGAPGRLEQVGSRDGAPIFVDYAHKPDALEKMLKAVRAMTRGRLVLVFGCGGDRDRGKRPIMGEIASRLADIVIVTDDNPRSESAATIRSEILAAAPFAIEIGDRALAIAHAVALLREGDILVVAGKGHETGQIIGARTLPFSDHGAIRTALSELAT